MERILTKVKHIEWKQRTTFSPPKVYVYWGNPDTGKTRTAAERDAVFCDYESRYPWAHYEGQEVVCIDEFTGAEQIKLSTLLRWLDGYKVTVQIPYEGNKPFIPKTIFICSNNSPNDWYPTESEARKRALFRRFTVVCQFMKTALGVMKRYSKGGHLDIKEQEHPEELDALDALMIATRQDQVQESLVYDDRTSIPNSPI